VPNLLDHRTAKLAQAIEEFMENPPRDMPEELSDQLTGLGQSLRGYSPEAEMSPGQREAARKTGEPYNKVATNEGASHSQFDKAMEAAKEAFLGQSPDNPTGA
jgi:hypothetical protein